MNKEKKEKILNNLGVFLAFGLIFGIMFYLVYEIVLEDKIECKKYCSDYDGCNNFNYVGNYVTCYNEAIVDGRYTRTDFIDKLKE